MPRRRVSLEEYLRLDQVSETKHDYIDGWMFDPNEGWWPGQETDVPDRHDRILRNVADALRVSSAHSANLLFGTSEFDPDMSVSVDGMPRLAFDVLSSSSEAVDRGEKSMRLRSTSSLEAHILLSQRTVSVEVIERCGPDEWRLTFLDTPHHDLRLPGL